MPMFKLPRTSAGRSAPSPLAQLTQRENLLVSRGDMLDSPADHAVMAWLVKMAVMSMAPCPEGLHVHWLSAVTKAKPV